MDNLLLVGAVSLATPIVLGIIVRLGAALERHGAAVIEYRALHGS